MVLCKYKRSVSRDDKPFYKVDEPCFKTRHELEAYRVIQRWNDAGGLAGNIKWRYDLVDCRPATLEEMKDSRIPEMSRDHC